MTNREIDELHILLVLEMEGATEKYWANTDFPAQIEGIDEAFKWSRSPEGYSYWRSIDQIVGHWS